jgi:cell division transport system permease protein
MPMALDRRPPEKPAPARPVVRGGASVVQLRWKDRFDAALDHHRVSAVDALQRMRRNWLTGLMTVLVIAVALSLPAVLYVVLDNLRALSGHVDGQARISLFLKMDVDERAQREFAARLSEREGVARVEVITREQALAEFRAQSGYGELLDALDGNPLPGVVVVQPAQVDEAEALHQALAAESPVELAQLDSAWLQKLAAMLTIGGRMTQALAVAFALAVLLVVVNTIRLAIESRREEILVVKLVGATDAFVRRPFLYSGLWFGLAGGLVAVLLVAGLVQWVEAPVAALVSLYGSSFILAGLGAAGALALVLAGAGLGLLGAWLAVMRHLREIEPT